MVGTFRREAEFVEMNLFQIDKDERQTRIGYKDQEMHQAAQDAREHEHQSEAIVSGCVNAAYMATGREIYTAQQGHLRGSGSIQQFCSP
ncbi:unnamed protein product [Albugo candida]|uniref:Uncharacterized protein n=1 Tax=Albugo candida TaxID=65357 RepID=A0A024FTX8_9STRA|nr:unnamed protein product [Albugo candida]|eukprot:CCI10598.1 unnamed protein product [Albugo candida]